MFDFFQEVVFLWANMTGFLCALGGVCLSQPNTSGSPMPIPGYEKKYFLKSFWSNFIIFSSFTGSMLSLDSKRNYSVAPVAEQYCPVTRFVKFFADF